MPDTRLEVSEGDAWALVTMSSGRGLNRLGTAVLGDLTAVIGQLLARRDLTCVGITGLGSSFAVGADLNEILALDPPGAREFSAAGNALFRLMERSHKLTVAAVDGFCLGGGLDLALAADWRMATPDSRLGHPGSDLGLITGFGGTQRLPRLVGTKSSLEMLMSSSRVDGRRAYEMGLVQELCREEDFMGQVRDRLERFGALPAAAVREIKSGLRQAAG